MPLRTVIHSTGEFYHIVNRGVAKLSIFNNKRDYERFLETLFYYQYSSTPFRYSYFARLQKKDKLLMLKNLREKSQLYGEIISFCLMPNHFHLLVKQTQEHGVMTFIRNVSNSYSRYINEKNKRVGPLWQGRFKSVHIATTEQLLHVDRYIHLNPYTAYIVKSIEDLYSYPYSSLNQRFTVHCKREYIDLHFKRQNAYTEFLLDQADYQRELNHIKHLLLE